MILNQNSEINENTPHCHLARILDIPIYSGDERIGHLQDLFTPGIGKTPEITFLVCSRPFGAPPYYIPWSFVQTFEKKKIQLKNQDYSKFIETPNAQGYYLEDQVLDQKIVDMNDRDVEVAYDLRLIIKDKKLFIAEVDISRYGLLCRLGLRSIAQVIYSKGKLNKQCIPWSAIQQLPGIESTQSRELKLSVLKENISSLPPVDLADILESLEGDQRVAIFTQLDKDHASDTLEQIDPHIQRELVGSLNNDFVADLINKMTPGQAADVLSALSHSDVIEILPLLDSEQSRKVKSIMDEQDQSILNFVTQSYLTVATDFTVEKALELYRHEAQNVEVLWYLHILDQDRKLIGIMDIPELVLSPPSQKLSEVMHKKVVTLSQENSLREAAEMFHRYGFRALPVCNEVGHILGVIPYQDVVKLRHRFTE